MASETRIVLLQRVRSNQGETLHFVSEQLSTKSRRARVGFVDKERVPEFEGDYGWFEVERVQATPWSYWQAIRQIEPPAGWAPPTPVRSTPSQLLGHR